jgi:hypothetical protein
LPEPERRDVDAHVEQAFSLVSAPTSDYPPRLFSPRFFPRLRSQALRLRAAVERLLGDLLYGRGLETAGKSIEVHHCDAATYEVPDDMTVAYFYYPFVGDRFRRVLADIIASLDRNPRCIRLIYVLPVMEEAILESGRFRLMRSLRIAGRKLPYRIGVYESVLPQGAP